MRNYEEGNAHLTQDFTRTIQTAQGYYRKALETESTKLGIALEIIARDGQIRAALGKGNRNELLSLALPLFQRLNTEYGITHFYFHDRQRVNLLRVHQPARYGDVIDRFTLRTAERTGTLAHGIELGPLGTFTLRVVAPVREGSHLLGYIELGEEIDGIIHDLQAVSQVELAVAIDKRYLNRTDWEAGMRQLRREPSWERFPGVVISAQTFSSAPKSLTMLLAGLPTHFPEGDIEIPWDKRQYRGRILPLEDAGGRWVGSLIVLRDLSARIQSNHAMLFSIGVAMLTLGSLLFGFFYFVFDRAEREIGPSENGGRTFSPSRQSMLTILITLVLTIFLAELAIMLSLPKDLPPVWGALIDAVMLVLLLHPVLYFLVLRPLSANIEQRLQAETTSTRLGRILDESTAEIYTFDGLSMRFIDASQGARNNLGYSLMELNQLTPLDLKLEFNLEQFRALIEPLRQGEQETLVFETMHRRKNGTLYPVEVHLQYSRTGAAPAFIAVIQDISERKHYIAELEHKALYDSLTDLPNRNLFTDRLKLALAVARRETKPLAIILLDIARLKEVNDILGHHNGDIVLQEVTRRIMLVLRATDTVARLGGDEFAMLLPSADKESATLVIEKIQKAMEPPALIDGGPLDIEVNMGVAVYPQHGEDPSVLLSRADVAMRIAKSEVSGFCIYESSHDPYNRRRLSLLGELRHAIAQNELVLYYQPQVDIASRKIMGVEALVRWPRTAEDMVLPVEFIPLAEQTGLIRPLTLWVLEEAVRQCGHWRELCHDLKVSINLSARNLLDPTLPDMLAKLLASNQVDADCLMLEVTESAVMLQPERALQNLTRLHEMGASLSVDDFGTGYSSLAYLKKLPVCELKIDQSFVFGMVKNENDAIIVRSTIDLAHNLGLKVVAEGIEDYETLQLLEILGCDTGQGYLFSKPIPPDDLSQWLSESPWGFSGKV